MYSQGSYTILNINFYTFLWPFLNDIPRSNTDTVVVNAMKVQLSILNEIFWKCTSKDQVWKII